MKKKPKKADLQKEYDELLSKITKAGFSLSEGKVKSVNYKWVMVMDAPYYSHYDGHTNDPIYYEDGWSIEIPSKIMNTDSDIIKFELNNTYDEGFDAEILYDGSKLGMAYFDYDNEDTLSQNLSEVKELIFKRINKTTWHVDYDKLNVKGYEDQGEHPSFTLEIHKMEVLN